MLERTSRIARRLGALALAAAAAGLLGACRGESHPLAGGTSSETVIGRAVLPDGSPAAGAAYRLRAADFLRLLPDPGAAKRAAVSAGTGSSAAGSPAAGFLAGGATTARSRLAGWDGSLDAEGGYRIDHVPPGDYRLEIRSGDGLGRLLPVTVAAGAGTTDMGKARLEPPGSVIATVFAAEGAPSDSALAQARVRIYGVERTESLGDSGRLRLADLAPGRYDLRISSSFPFPQAAEIPGLEIRPGGTADAGEIRLVRVLGNAAVAPVPEGILAYWPFDGDGGADPVGGRDARLQGNPGWTEGVRGRALALDGVDDHAAIPALSLAGDFTIAAWVRLEGRIDNNQMLASRSDSANLNFAFGRLRLYHGERRPAAQGAPPGEPAWDVVAAGTPMVPGAWTHVAVTRRDGALTVYSGGRADGTGLWSGTLPLDAIGQGPLDTDAPPGPGNLGRLQGALDEVRIYGRALSAAEVAALAALVGTAGGGGVP